MHKNRFPAIMLAGSLLGASVGCSGAAGSYESTSDPQVAVIDPYVLPNDEPPAAVQALAKNVVRLASLDTTSESSDGAVIQGYSSGIFIEENLVLASGHALYNPQKKYSLGPVTLPKSRESTLKALPFKCGDVVVESGNENDLVNSMSEGKMIGSETTALKFTGNYDESWDGEDLSLIQTLHNAPVDLEPVQFRDTPVEKGEAVYFINFQPTADQVFRSPVRRQGYVDDIDQMFTSPAIYGGISLERSEEGKFLDVVSGIKSYGEIFDVDSRPGASGGVLVDTAAALFGMVVQVSSNEKYSVIEDHYKVDVVPEFENTKHSLSFVQLVNSRTVSKLKNDLPDEQSCIPNNP